MTGFIHPYPLLYNPRDIHSIETFGVIKHCGAKKDKRKKKEYLVVVWKYCQGGTLDKHSYSIDRVYHRYLPPHVLELS